MAAGCSSDACLLVVLCSIVPPPCWACYSNRGRDPLYQSIMATSRAPLSRNEETTLRLIAHGAAAPGELRLPDIQRLALMGLIEQTDGNFIVTAEGGRALQRLADIG